MSRTSCISHPEGERLILIRKWQLEACSKDACAAALLNLFEYWHNIKLEQKWVELQKRGKCELSTNYI